MDAEGGTDPERIGEHDEQNEEGNDNGTHAGGEDAFEPMPTTAHVRPATPAFCCSGAVASVGYFCSALVAGPNCASRGRCGRFSWLLGVAFWVNERSVVPGAICRDERDDRDCCVR